MKEEIMERVNTTIEEGGYDALLIFGYDNIQYLTGAHLHFPQTFPDRYMALFWPKGELPTTIVPHEWESSFLNLAWVNKTRTYTEKPGSPSSIVETAVLLAKNTIRKTHRSNNIKNMHKNSNSLCNFKRHRIKTHRVMQSYSKTPYREVFHRCF